MLTGQHYRVGAGRGLSPAPVSPAAGPVCPERDVSSASVSPENAHMPGGGVVLTGSPGAQSSPDVSSAAPLSPLPSPQPQPRQPVPLEGRMGEWGSVWIPASVPVHPPSGWTSPRAPKFIVSLYQIQLSIFPKPYDVSTIISPISQMGNTEAKRGEVPQCA